METILTCPVVTTCLPMLQPAAAFLSVDVHTFDPSLGFTTILPNSVIYLRVLRVFGFWSMVFGHHLRGFRTILDKPKQLI